MQRAVWRFPDFGHQPDQCVVGFYIGCAECLDRRGEIGDASIVCREQGVQPRVFGERPGPAMFVFELESLEKAVMRMFRIAHSEIGLPRSVRNDWQFSWRCALAQPKIRLMNPISPVPPSSGRTLFALLRLSVRLP